MMKTQSEIEAHVTSLTKNAKATLRRYNEHENAAALRNLDKIRTRIKALHWVLGVCEDGK